MSCQFDEEPLGPEEGHNWLLYRLRGDRSRLQNCHRCTCKQSGMFWGRPGAQNIPALRCIQASGRLNQFWKERLNSRAALNDSLALSA